MEPIRGEPGSSRLVTLIRLGIGIFFSRSLATAASEWRSYCLCTKELTVWTILITFCTFCVSSTFRVAGFSAGIGCSFFLCEGYSRGCMDATALVRYWPMAAVGCWSRGDKPEWWLSCFLSRMVLLISAFLCEGRAFAVGSCARALGWVGLWAPLRLEA